MADEAAVCVSIYYDVCTISNAGIEASQAQDRGGRRRQRRRSSDGQRGRGKSPAAIRRQREGCWFC